MCKPLAQALPEAWDTWCKSKAEELRPESACVIPLAQPMGDVARQGQTRPSQTASHLKLMAQAGLCLGEPMLLKQACARLPLLPRARLPPLCCSLASRRALRLTALCTLAKWLGCGQPRHTRQPHSISAGEEARPTLKCVSQAAGCLLVASGVQTPARGPGPISCCVWRPGRCALQCPSSPLTGSFPAGALAP